MDQPSHSGSAISSLCERLRRIEEDLQNRSVEELGTGRPLNSNVAEAIQAIQGVRIDLLALGGPGDTGSGGNPARSIEQEQIERAASEVNSGEFDVQG